MDEFQTKLMCEVLGVSRTTYYAWRKRGPSQREQDDRVLLKEIHEIHENSRQTYGSPEFTGRCKREVTASAADVSPV